MVKKPVTLRWCTKPKPKAEPKKPSYLPPVQQAPPSYPQPPVYKAQEAKPGSPLPTSSPVYFKPVEDNSGRRFTRQNGYRY